MQSLQWLGIGEVGSDYLNLICEPGYEDQVCQIVGDEICQNINQWDLLRLTDLPTQCLTYTNLLTRFATNKGFSYQPGREYICPYIPLSNYSWASFFEGLSENTRYNLRRRKRQVFEALGAEIKCCEDMTDVKPFLNSIFELHAQRWQARGGSDGFSSPQVQAFHQDVAARLFAKGWLKLYLMESKGQPIAGIYGLEYGDTFSFYQSGMSPQWDRYSVGMVLLGETIKESFSRKLAIYDFLHGTEEYKFKWTKTLRHTSSLMVCPRNRLAPNFYFWLRTLKQKFARPNLQAAS